jgi:hypothetical protein
MFKGIAACQRAVPWRAARAELSNWPRNPSPDRRGRIDIGISADQIAANHVGGLTSLPSLELATMPQTHKENQDGLNEGYYSHSSFSSPTQALPAEINPRNVLNRLFFRDDRTGTSGEADPLDGQMLDLVLGGERNLRRRLPQSDQGEARRISRQLPFSRTSHCRRRTASTGSRLRQGRPQYLATQGE